MALPTAIQAAIAQNQPLTPSSERSKYSEAKETWATSSGVAAQELTGADQWSSFGVAVGLAFGAYHAVPTALEYLNRNLNQSSRIQNWQLNNGTFNATTVGQALSVDNGKQALKRIRANTLQDATESLNLDYSSKANFWYSGLKRIEQAGTGVDIPGVSSATRRMGINMPLFDNVVKMFTRATYLTEVLSYHTKPKGQTVLNVSATSLGFNNRRRTLDLYADQLNPLGNVAGRDSLRRQLDMTNYLVFESGRVYEGRLDRSGRVVAGNALGARTGTGKTQTFTAARGARLVDKGKYTEALLSVAYPELGIKNPGTGGTFAEGIGGAEGKILLREGAIDANLEKFIDRAYDLIGATRNAKTQGRIRNIAEVSLTAEAYSSMALQRTSNLITEMFNEAGNFFEYLNPEGKRNVYKKLYDAGIAPRMQHGHGFAMLGRYSRLAVGVGLGLSAVNQVGFTMQHGNAITSSAAGAIQTAGLAVGGAYLSHKFMGRSAPGLMAGAGLGLLGMAGVGPFAGGPIPGVANLFARANELRSYAGEFTQMNKWRRTVEQVAPGATSGTAVLGMGILASTGYVLATRYLNRDAIVEQQHRMDYLKSRFADNPTASLESIRQRVKVDTEDMEKVRQRYKPQFANAANSATRDRLETAMSGELRAIRSAGVSSSASQARYARRAENLSEKQMGRIEEEILSYSNKLDKEGEFGKLRNPIAKGVDVSNFESLAEDVGNFSYERSRQHLIATTKGPLLRGMKERLLGAMRVAPKFKAIAYGTVAFAAPLYVALGGLGTTETPEELRELNQGKRLEAVRRNQKWEMGQGAYEGDDVLYYRPTLTARLSSGATQAGSSGNRGPLEELILKNFTYKLERENYYKRPAPITGAAFDQVPFIYPFIQPIADIIKKPKLMHVGEWSKTDDKGNVKLLERTSGMEETPEEGMGGLSMAAPYSPYSTGRVLGKFWQQATSLSGLVGYFARTAKLATTGSQGFYDQREELESFSQSTDMASKFYDLQGGGSFLGVPLTSEVIRRFVHKNELEQYNPIENTMPSWLPSSMKYGNPSSSMKYGGGEYRTPGEGYEALHKELKGMNPEDYPLLHKLNILGDVAPYSPEYKFAERQAMLMKSAGDMTEGEQKFFYRHQQNVKNRKERKQYDSYEFKPSSYNSMSGTVTSVDAESLTFTMSGYGGRFGVAGVSNDSAALISDYNLSIKEAAKVRAQNKQAFSSKVEVGDTLSVSVPASIGHAVDESGIIKASIRNNGFNVNEDIAEEGQFAKDDSRISNFAMTNPIGRSFARMWEAGTHAANQLAQPIEHIMMFGAAPVNKLLPYRSALEDYEAREVYGVEMKGWEDPIGGWIGPAVKTALHNYLGLDFESPGLSKKRDTEEYFDKIKYLKYTSLGEEARKQGDFFLENQYTNAANSTAIGSSGFVSDESLANTLGGRESMFASGFASEYNPGQQAGIMEALPDFKKHIMEGFYLNKDLDAINRAATMGGMSTTGMDYAADLLARKQNQGFDKGQNPEDERLSQMTDYFQYKSVPRADWIGFNPAVDLEDVKLKYIENEGMDYHDFGIYPSRASYMPRKPFINEGVVSELNNTSYVDPLAAMSAVNKRMGAYGVAGYNIQGPTRNQSFVNFTVEQNNTINPYE